MGRTDLKIEELPKLREMNKAQVIKEIEEIWEETAPTGMTVLELKAYVKEKREVYAAKHETGEKIKGLDTLKKAELQRLCEERGIPVKTHTVRAKMITLLKENLARKDTPIQDEVDRLAETADVTSLDVERKHQQDKKSDVERESD